MTKIRATFTLSSEAVERLEKLANRDNRSKSNKLEVLINEAYELIKENGSNDKGTS